MLGQGGSMSDDKQKEDLVDKLWQAGNLITGYGIVQSVTLTFALTNGAQGVALSGAWRFVCPGVLIIGAVLALLVRAAGRRELALRFEVGCGDSVKKTVASIASARIWVIAVSHLGAAAALIGHAAGHHVL
jgi:hypothetical protein